jgi:hypothetical protein
MGLKVYIAAPWRDRHLMPDIAKQVEEIAGCRITHRWWEVENTPEGERNIAVLREQAEKDVMGVLSAQVVLVMNTAKSEGKAVEQGLAIGAGVPIVVVGKRGELSQNVFHYLPAYKWVDTLEEALVKLIAYSKAFQSWVDVFEL